MVLVTLRYYRVEARSRQENPYLQRNRVMHTIPTGRNISVHFTAEELVLLKEFDQYCKNNFTTKSGWVKRNIHKQLQEQKRLLANK